MTERTWFYAYGQTRQGPVPESALRQYIASGNLPPMAQVWTEGMAQWQTLATIPAFAGMFPPPAAPGMGGGTSMGMAVGGPPPIGYATPVGPGMAPNLGDDLGMRMLLPVGRSGWAIASGYLGLLSVIPFVGIVAIITGIIAVNNMRRNPKLHGMGRAIFGMVMGGLCTAFYLFYWGGAVLRYHHW